MKKLVLIFGLFFLVGCSSGSGKTQAGYFLQASTCETPSSSFTYDQERFSITQFYSNPHYPESACHHSAIGSIEVVGGDLVATVEQVLPSNACPSLSKVGDSYTVTDSGNTLTLESDSCLLTFEKKF